MIRRAVRPSRVNLAEPIRPFRRTAVVLLFGAAFVACDGLEVSGGNGNGNGDCPAVLPEAEVVCNTAGCSAMSGTRDLGTATVRRSDAESWFVVASVASDFVLNENVSVDFGFGVPGALVPTSKDGSDRRPEAKRWSPERLRRIESLRRRQRAEAWVRSGQRRTGWDPTHRFAGTALVPASFGPEQQARECAKSAPDCGAGSICVLAPGSEMGTCESRVIVRLGEFFGDPASGGTVSGFREVEAAVREVGDEVAVLVDVEDAVSDQDVIEIVDRFDRHIAPTIHSVFGRPVLEDGGDFDGNGVVLLLLSSQVGQISDFGEDLVGFFFSDDLLDVTDPGTPDWSNGADILYMQPAGPSISLDALSGTIGHEYQHLVNHTFKVLRNRSQPEAVWLDEGLSTFAEELLGYGVDAYDNIALYLEAVSSTSLTGAGFVPGASADTSERRGMAALFVRYFFEQSGAATVTGPGQVVDGGGAQAVRSLVASADTGVDLFTEAATGRPFETWLEDLLLTVALDGTDVPDVSCNPRHQFASTEIDPFTGGQRGVDLRGSATGLGTLEGPAFEPFGAVQDLPVPVNGGDFRLLNLSPAEATVSWSTPVTPDLPDLSFRLRVVPAGP